MIKIKQNYIDIAFFFLVCLLFSFIGLFSLGATFTAILFYCGCTFTLAVLSSRLRCKSDLLVFWGSYIVKSVYVLYRVFAKFGGNIVEPQLSLDASRFWNAAVNMYTGVNTSTDTWFPHVLKMEFSVFGQNLFCVLMLNIFLTMLMMIIVIEIFDRAEIYDRHRMIPLLIVGFLPYEIIVSCSLLRESIYFVFITLSFFCYSDYITTKKYSSLLFAIVALLPVVLLHMGYMAVGIVYIIDSFINNKPTSVKDYVARFFLLIVIIAISIYLVSMDRGGAGYLSRGISGVINRITDETGGGYSEDAGSRYLSGLTINSLGTLILYTPLKCIFFILSPLPMNWRGFSDIMAFLLDSCIHLYVILSVLSAKKIIRKLEPNYKNSHFYKILNVGLWSVLLVALLFCLNTGTAGTAIRHRDVMIGIEATLLGISMQVKKGTLHETII